MRALVIGNTGEGAHARYCSAFTSALGGCGVETTLVGYPSLPSPWYTRFAPSRAADRLIRLGRHAAHLRSAVRKGGMDIVHFQLLSPAVDCWWIPRATANVPSVLTLHNVQPHRRSVLHSRWATDSILRAMSAVIVHSESNRRLLAALHPHVGPRIHVIPHGVWDVVPMQRNEARASLALREEAFVVLFFGALRANKGLGRLLESVLLVSAELRTRLVILVAGAATREVTVSGTKEAIRTRGIEAHVVFIPGYASDEQLARYFASADVVALPYDASFQAQSGVLFDAYASGIPVIVSDTGALGETVNSDRSGVVLEGNDPTLIAMAVEGLMRDRERLDRLREGVRGAQVRYSWPSTASKTRDLYLQLLGGRRPTSPMRR